MNLICDRIENFLRCNQAIDISQSYYEENVWMNFTWALRTCILYDEYRKKKNVDKINTAVDQCERKYLRANKKSNKKKLVTGSARECKYFVWF